MAACQYCRETLQEEDARRRLTVCRVCAPPPYECDRCGAVQSEWPDRCPECAAEYAQFLHLQQEAAAGLSFFVHRLGGEVIRSEEWEWRLGPIRFNSGGGDIEGARARVNQWTMTAHTAVRRLHESESDELYLSHISVPYWARAGFSFEIRREGLLGKVGKVLGSQDVKVGHADVDDRFIIKADDGLRVRALLEDQTLRGLLLSTPIDGLAVLEGEWSLEGDSEGVNYLELKPEGGLKNPEHAQSVHDLLAETLNRLVEIGAASEEAPPPEE